ncbi:MAG: phosphopantetheine-binding protein [Actinomycetaceae bacterium]|nr:phosphopantetheine-binding protein [Actinomycetaceae bacterium]
MSNSFADLLGSDFLLPDEETTEEDSQGTLAETTDATDKIWETVVSAMLDVSDLPAENYQPQLELAADFDLHPIALYAVVSRIEEDLKIKLKDTEVQQARTLADLVELTAAALA